MLKDKSLTYVTLFSSAGVGCHGFQMEGYRCIATNEIIGCKCNVVIINVNLIPVILLEISHPMRLNREFMMRSTGGRKKAMIVWTLSLLRHPVRASASLTIKRTVRK